MSWVFGLRLSPPLKMILMALADHADDAGYCWPSIPRIAAKASMSDRTVQRRLPELVARGLVVVSSRPPKQDGSQSSRGYQLMLDGGDSVSPPPAGRQNVTAPVTPVSPPPVTPVSPKPSYIPVSRSSRSTSSPCGREHVHAGTPSDAAAAPKKNDCRRAPLPSGIVCYTDDDPTEAERVEATYSAEEISAGVKSARQKLNARGNPLKPTPGTVENEILLARAEDRKKVERAKSGTGCSPPVPVSAAHDLRNELAYIEQMHSYKKFSDDERDQQIAAARARYARPA